MGHNIVPAPPKSTRWKHVAGLVEGGADPAMVAGASIHAAENDLAQIAGNPVFVEAIRLLAGIPVAAASRNPAQAFHDLGTQAGATPSLTDLMGAVSARLDGVAKDAGGGSDFGELCRRALISTLITRIGDELPGLIPSEDRDVIIAASALRRPEAFAASARDFFGVLLSQTLSNWVDRLLPLQVGPGQRFAHAGERAAFSRALDLHVWETTRIIQEFSVGWYGKSLGGAAFDRERARGFGGHAITKIRKELLREAGYDA